MGCLVVGRCMGRIPCIAGRATTCWKAYRKEDLQTLLVIKDSWQYMEREEESELLREVTDQGVVNMARYYHHENVQIGGVDDDIQSNVRKGLDVITAENYRAGRPAMSRIQVELLHRKVAAPQSRRCFRGEGKDRNHGLHGNWAAS